VYIVVLDWALMFVAAIAVVDIVDTLAGAKAPDLFGGGIDGAEAPSFHQEAILLGRGR
jgi:hypothetical protein